MLNFKKELLLLVTTCILVFSLVFSGCSGNDTPDVPNDDVVEKTDTPSNVLPDDEKPLEDELEPVALKWMLFGTKQEDSDMVWAEWNKKLQEDFLPNTTVEFEAIPPSEYKEKWGLAMASGEQIDIAWLGYATNISEDIAKGSYLPLNDLIENYASDITKELPEWIIRLGSVDGVIYSIPNYQQMTELRIGMRTHKELADKFLDIEQMEQDFYATTSTGQFRCATQGTYDIIEEYLETLKENGELRLGFSPSIIDDFNIGVSFPASINMRLPNKEQEWDYTLYPFYELEEYKLYEDTMHEWFKKEYIRQDFLGLQSKRADEGKEDGYIAWFHETFINTAEKKSATYGFDVVVVPLEPDYYISRLESATSVAIPRTSIDPERAIKVIDLMHTEKGVGLLNMLIYGIEGVHYEMAGDNYVKTLHYDSQSASADNPYGLSNWAVGNTFIAALNQANPSDYNEYIEGIHDNSIVAPFIGFKPDSNPIINEIAQVNAVSGEFSNIWAYNDYEARWDEMVEKLKTAGIETVRDEFQNQLDAYLEANDIK